VGRAMGGRDRDVGVVGSLFGIAREVLRCCSILYSGASLCSMLVSMANLLRRMHR